MMKSPAQDAPVSPALVIKNGRVHAVGSRPVHRRRLAVMAATLALTSLAATLLPLAAQSRVASLSPLQSPVALEAPVAHDIGWSDGWGVDWAQFERACKQRGFTPSQTLLATALLDRLSGVQLMGRGAQEDPSVAAGLVDRARLANELKASLATPSGLLAFAQQLNESVQDSQAATAQRVQGFDAVAYLAAVGWNEDDAFRLEGLLDQARQPEQGLSWSELSQVRAQENQSLGSSLLDEAPAAASPATWAQARQALEDAVEQTGLAQLHVSASLVSTPAQTVALANHLVNLQADMADRLGVSGPVLGLGGRVRLDLALPSELGTHGQVVTAQHGVTMRTALHALPHEHFHALSALMASEHAHGAEAMKALLDSFGQAVPLEHRQALAQEARAQFEQHMEHLALSAPLRQQLRTAQDGEGRWEALYDQLTQQEGLYDQDARMVLMMAMSLSSDYESQNGGLPRWASLRQAVGRYLQSSGDLESSLLGQYTGSQEETLASAYAAQFEQKWTHIPGVSLGILDAPGAREAELQSVAWQHFAQQASVTWSVPASSTKGWRENRQAVAHQDVARTASVRPAR